MMRVFIAIVVAIPVLWASNTNAQTAEPAAKLVVDPPLAETLSRGVAFINYRTENLQVVPVFGSQALNVSPASGISMSRLMARNGSGRHQRRADHHRGPSSGTAQGRDYPRKRKPSASASAPSSNSWSRQVRFSGVQAMSASCPKRTP